jgi:hypothetical protein
MTQDIHVRAKRTHLTPTGVVTAHVHQFGDSALFGFDVYVGDNVAVETLHRASVSETNSTLEGAKRAADAAVHGTHGCGTGCAQWVAVAD